jgi:hypothetical protein
VDSASISDFDTKMSPAKAKRFEEGVGKKKKKKYISTLKKFIYECINVLVFHERTKKNNLYYMHRIIIIK